MNAIQKQLIKAGVKNLKQFGYPGVNEQNILTDAVYSAFFRPMLEDAKGSGHDADIDEILKQLPV